MPPKTADEEEATRQALWGKTAGWGDLLPPQDDLGPSPAGAGALPASATAASSAAALASPPPWSPEAVASAFPWLAAAAQSGDVGEARLVHRVLAQQMAGAGAGAGAGAPLAIHAPNG